MHSRKNHGPSGYLDGLLALPGPGHPGDREDTCLHRAARRPRLGQHSVRDDLGVEVEGLEEEDEMGEVHGCKRKRRKEKLKSLETSCQKHLAVWDKAFNDAATC